MLDRLFKILGCLYFGGCVIRMVDDVIEFIRRKERQIRWRQEEMDRIEKRFCDFARALDELKPQPIPEHECVCASTVRPQEDIY